MNLLDLFGVAMLMFLPGKGMQKWVVEKHSHLTIGGRTNFNRFSCRIGEYAEPDTICFVPAPGNANYVGLHGSMSVAIDDFYCDNRMMTSEFRKALRHHEYPTLTIAFLSLDRMPAPGSEAQAMKGWVEIGLSGAVRRFEIAYHTVIADEGKVVLTGYRELAFSDFGLEPPRKMGGLVKVKDALQVEFTLCLRRLYQG